MSSWAKGTKKQYATPINRWLAYCKTHNLNPCQATFEQGAEFITELFYSSKLEYSVMNTTRSALSAVIVPINGITFGKHPLITRLLKAIYKQRPSLPKYTVTYDVNIVLEYLKTLPQNRDNSLEIHTKKLATLMCLLSGQRSQTLGVLTLDAMYLTEGECTFLFLNWLKLLDQNFTLPHYNSKATQRITGFVWYCVLGIILNEQKSFVLNQILDHYF